MINSIEEALQCLDECASLEPNWDSYGAPIPDAESIANGKRAVEIAFELDFPPDWIGADAMGGVGLVWHKAQHKGASLSMENEEDEEDGAVFCLWGENAVLDTKEYEVLTSPTLNVASKLIPYTDDSIRKAIEEIQIFLTK